MNQLRFTKMHGIGNDFILIDGVSEPLPPADFAKLSKQLNDRKMWIGGDGLILVSKGEADHLKMRMFNPDGSEAEMCGNGIRCVAKLARTRKLSDANPIPIETGAGLLQLETLDSGACGTIDAVRVDMGLAGILRTNIPMTGAPDEQATNFELSFADQTVRATAVSMGNPHCVIFVENAEQVPIEKWGPIIETHALFPNRTNVHFVQVNSATELTMRTWERGAGVTLACGTGACGVLVAAFLNGKAERKAKVHLPGGDLEIEYCENGRVFMTGPAETVFEGVWVG